MVEIWLRCEKELLFEQTILLSISKPKPRQLLGILTAEITSNFPAHQVAHNPSYGRPENLPVLISRSTGQIYTPSHNRYPSTAAEQWMHWGGLPNFLLLRN